MVGGNSVVCGALAEAVVKVGAGFVHSPQPVFRSNDKRSGTQEAVNE